MAYDFIVDTYATERIKVISVWSMFKDEDLDVRPHPRLDRDRTAHEHMVHQCQSEERWFRTMFDIDLGTPALPERETRLAFIQHYADASGRRLALLREKKEAWWEQDVAFFDTTHSRAWIMVRRVAHTAHHRGEQTTLLRLMGRQVHSVYGPSIDTGGLPIHNALTINAYADVASLIEGELHGGRKAALPGPGNHPSTERPDR